jgi:hypothetical protein
MPPNAYVKPSPSPGPGPGEVTVLIDTQNELTKRLIDIISILGNNNIGEGEKDKLKAETEAIKNEIADIQDKIKGRRFLGQSRVEELLGGRRRRLRKTRRVRRSKKTYRKRR